MEGPYRDLGSGFVRLLGAETSRRAPSRIRTVEDALTELLRNARDAGANNIYVASTLRSRRYRTLTVLDDGSGIPEAFKDLVFEPGVTTRHLQPTTSGTAPHGAGLSLYHLKTAALTASLASCVNPTSLTATFDTKTLPEHSNRANRSNLPATLRAFKTEYPDTNLYCSSPAGILAILLKNHIIQTSSSSILRTRELWKTSEEIGLEVSLRTVQRVLRGEIAPAGMIEVAREDGELESWGDDGGRIGADGSSAEQRGPVLTLSPEEKSEVEDILGRIARASYLEIGAVELESRPGELTLRAPVYEPEEEYDY